MLGVLAALGIVYASVDPAAHQWMPRCVVHELTGLSCPGCGFQRFLHALLHGRVGEAVAYNYWLVAVLPYALALVVAWLWPDGRTKDRMRSVLENRWLVYAYIVSFFAWFLVRNALHI